MHDSAERYPPGKCHSGTREKIINNIMDWINDPNTSHFSTLAYQIAMDIPESRNAENY